jgi:hypothetical protein
MMIVIPGPPIDSADPIIFDFMHTFLKGDIDEKGVCYINILYSAVPVYGRECAGPSDDWL